MEAASGGVWHKIKEKKSKKKVFIDLAFAIFQKQQPQVQITRRKVNTMIPLSRVVSDGRKRAKKTKVVPGFQAPKWLSIEVLCPVEFDTEILANRTSQVESIGSVKIDFDNFFK